MFSSIFQPKTDSSEWNGKAKKEARLIKKKAQEVGASL